MNINLTLFGQIISFAFFVWFCFKYVWPPIIKAIDDRQKKIAEGLNQAEQSHKMLQDASAQCASLIKKSKQEVNEIVANTQKVSQSMIDKAREDAKIQFDDIVSSGQEQLIHMRARALKEMESEIGTLVMQGVVKIVGREVDQSVHEDLLDELRNQLVK